MCISMNLEVLGENWEGNKRGHLEKKKKGNIARNGRVCL